MLNTQTAEVIAMPSMDIDIQELRQWTDGYVKGQGVTVATMATEAGINRSLLSQFINHGKYNQNIIDSLLQLRKRLEPPKDDVAMAAADTEELPHSPVPQKDYKHEVGIIRTEDFQQALGICSMCHRDGEIGVIIGHAGSGKTTALEEFCMGRSDVVYIRAKITMSVKGLLIAIGEGLGLGVISGSRERMLGQIIAALRESPTMLVVDEADQLVGRMKIDRIETLRDIWDEAHVGMVICGMPKLAKFLVKGPGGDDNLAQIYSRIRRAYKMKGVNRDELLQILSAFNIDEQAKKYLLARGASLTHGGLRRLSRILQNALDMTEEGEAITLEIIKEADGLLVTPETLGLSI